VGVFCIPLWSTGFRFVQIEEGRINRTGGAQGLSKYI